MIDNYIPTVTIKNYVKIWEKKCQLRKGISTEKDIFTSNEQ